MRRLIVSVGFAAILCAAPGARAQCEPVWSGLGAGAGWEVRDFAVFDDGGEGTRSPTLFVGGGFDTIAGIHSPRIARWDGWSASPVGEGLAGLDTGVQHVRALDKPAGMIPAGLYVGGTTIESAGGVPVSNLVRWADGEWHDVGGGVSRGTWITHVFASEIFDDGSGPALFVGGKFDFAGGVPVDGLARWDGKQWSEVGGGLSDHRGPRRVSVKDMTIYDDGRGPALYVAGGFSHAGGKEAWNIARWDGVEWEPVGPGINGGGVFSLCVFDEDGPGPQRPALFAGGGFSEVRGGEPRSMMRIGRWDGSEWTAVGGWLSAGSVQDMIVWDGGGPGPKKHSLYIGGFFDTMPDGSPANRLARWNGEQWHTVGGGVSSVSGFGPTVHSLHVFDEDGPGPNPGGLYVGGLFSHAGGVPARNIARWGCPLPASRPCYADCDGDGELTFFDFLCFQNLFAAADPGADCDQSGALDFFDFLCFQNAFIAGCP